MYSCTSIEACIQAIMLESAKVGNIADSLIGQANGIEVGDVFGCLILLYILANKNTNTYINTDTNKNIDKKTKDRKSVV